MNRMLASSGYTIVEVMMFLAVSSGLLAAAMATISGQQAKTEFTTSVRDFESRLQDVLNDVATGTYPPFNAKCKIVAGVPTPNAGTSEQGTNEDCVFVGKAMQFAPSGAEGRFDIYTLAGRRQIPATATNPIKEVGNIQEANPRILGNTGETIDSVTLRSSLAVRKMFVGPAPGTELYGIAFTPTFGQTDPARGGVITGSSSTALLKMNGIGRGESFSTFSSAAAALDPADAVTQTVTICVADKGGSGGRKGAVQISGRGTDILFDDDATTAGCPA